MADGGLYTKPKSKPKQRVATSSATTNTANTSSATQNKKNPSKFYTHFMFKTIIVAIFLVIIALFPSETPSSNVANPSFFSRWWELFHLIFVGIAVSYGLFSRKNDDIEGDTNSKFDSAQSYVSKLLQVPPVFDDDVDTSIGCDDHNHHNINKVQTWSSQYYRNDPVVVVAKKNSSNLDKNDNMNSINSGVLEKPLLLPVRSLKSRVSEEKDDELVNSGVSRVYARSNSSLSAKEFASDSRRISRNDVKLVSGEDSGVTRGYTRSNSGKGFVNESRRISRNDSLKSRARIRNESGFVNKDVNGDGEVSRSLSKSNKNSSSRGYLRRHSTGDYGSLDGEQTEEREDKVEEGVVLPSPIPWRSRSGSMEINRESFDSSLHSLPASLEESGAAHLVRSQSSLSARSSSSSSSAPSPNPSSPLPSPKRLSPSPSLASESLAKGVEDYGRRKLVYGSQLPPPPPPPPPPPFHKSKNVKSKSSQDNEGNSNHHKDLKRSVWSEPKDVGRGSREESLYRTKTGFEAKARNGIDNSSVGKSVRTVRAGEMTPTRRTREIQHEEGRSEDNVSGVNENIERKTAGYNTMSRSSFSEFPKETRDFLEQVMAGTDDETESEDENEVEERVETPKVEEAHPETVDEGPDVDKKADEFIAKFREQIRLQRIESIKRSTGQLKRSTVR